MRAAGESVSLTGAQGAPGTVQCGLAHPGEGTSEPGARQTRIAGESSRKAMRMKKRRVVAVGSPVRCRSASGHPRRHPSQSAPLARRRRCSVPHLLLTSPQEPPHPDRSRLYSPSVPRPSVVRDDGFSVIEWQTGRTRKRSGPEEEKGEQEETRKRRSRWAESPQAVLEQDVGAIWLSVSAGKSGAVRRRRKRRRTRGTRKGEATRLSYAVQLARQRTTPRLSRTTLGGLPGGRGSKRATTKVQQLRFVLSHDVYALTLDIGQTIYIARFIKRRRVTERDVASATQPHQLTNLPRSRLCFSPR